MASLLVIDDDELSREVLVLLATQEGYVCAEAESGEVALELLSAPGAALPNVVLTDMQMPGVTGESLARLLRMVCGPETVLLAMSATEPEADALRGFDGFLLKPFAMPELAAAVAGRSRRAEAVAGTPALNEAVYASFAGVMPGSQVRALYAMCLDDAEKRFHAMEAASVARDADAYARAAHAIKGGCGMVGAAELAGLAAAMETGGLPELDSKAPFAEFMSAIARLRRMLDARTD